MDSETECSVVHSGQDDHQVVSPDDETRPDDHNNEIRNNGNGSCTDQTHDLAIPENLADVQTRQTQPSEVESKSPPGEISSPPTRGFGLKKWRRIRRDGVKDSPSPTVDSSKILKRLLTGNDNSSKHQHEMKVSSEGSVGSVNVLKNAGAGAVDGFAFRSVDSDSRNAVGSVFVAGTDSENSEDRSSKSSTAASAPKAKFDQPAVLGQGREKNKVKGMSAKTLGNSSQRIPQGKAKIESSKKARGERVRFEKENSHSSIESDSRSSNFCFTQGSNVSSNGKQIGRSVSYDGENSEDAHANEQQFSEDVQTSFSKKNVGEVEDLQDDSAAENSWGVKEGKSGNNMFSTGRDPLVESMLSLQSVQEALEKEVKKLAEIRKEPILADSLMEGGSVHSDSASPGIQEPYLSNQLNSEKSTQMDVVSLQAKVLSLEQNVKVLESKLDESKNLLVSKETKVAELKATINSTKFLKEESGSTIDLQDKSYRQIENELEGLFKQRIEAEIEFLLISMATQNLKVIAEKQTTLFEEQETTAEEQAQMLNKLGNAEIKAAKLEKQAHELEKHWGDIFESEEVLVTRRKVHKVTWCVCTQSILLILVLWCFVLQLTPLPEAVVPT
ncbi:WPP domain-interacting protein 2-like [Humulus lupulus]|uniref:WPP domain-interacting protein 2-like n=1 Tax=Humulus lupulus TaxID=3486 RepID=UPI002B413D04|nr:WPP domain-interacting protein 2-like [Humulus lupulus]